MRLLVFAPAFLGAIPLLMIIAAEILVRRMKQRTKRNMERRRARLLAKVVDLDSERRRRLG